jgi:heme exporter protein CcmD
MLFDGYDFYVLASWGTGLVIMGLLFLWQIWRYRTFKKQLEGLQQADKRS